MTGAKLVEAMTTTMERPVNARESSAGLDRAIEMIILLWLKGFATVSTNGMNGTMRGYRGLA